MELLVFLPGILGSKLETPEGEEVWPPTPLEALRGYNRTAKLLQPDLTPTGIVERVCIDVYGSLLNALEEIGYTKEGKQHRLVRHAYDWRRDLVQLAGELGTALNALIDEHGSDVEIKLICHSMGGLVARALLEGSDLSQQPWAKVVKLAIFLATPHEGAPLAFARAVGVGGSTLGLSAAQLRQLAEAPGFPAAYQLFPPAQLQPLWKLSDPIPFKSVSLFDRAVAENYELIQAHLNATSVLHSRLDPTRRPADCRYFSIVSAAHETITRLDEDQNAATTVSVKSSGDGTVPIQSATALRIPTAFVEANHIGVTQKSLTHRMIGMLLGATPVEPLPMAFDVDPQSSEASMNLSLSERTIAEGQGYEIVVVTTPRDLFEATVRIKKHAPSGAAVVSELPIAVRTKGVERISLKGPSLSSGQYMFELVAEGNDVASADNCEELLVTGQDNA